MSEARTDSTENHTPGPWEVTGNNGYLNQWAIGRRTPCGIDPIAAAYGAGTELLANARLIAAAPDMLAALKAAQKDLETVQREMSGIAPEAISPALPLIRAAIAKAEGRS